jgi:hypothetical protein
MHVTECSCLPPSPRLARGGCLEPQVLATSPASPNLFSFSTLLLSHIFINLYSLYLYLLNFHSPYLHPFYLQSSADRDLHSTCVSARCATGEVSHLE